MTLPSTETDTSPARADAPAAAFFDLDRTLISGSSTFRFAIAAWREGLIPTGTIARDVLDNLVFRLAGATDERSERMRDRLLGAVEGVRHEDLVALNEQIVPAVLRRLRPEARQLLEMHAEAGRDRYLVSASPVEFVTQLAGDLGLEGGIGTEAEVVDGVYTGRLAGPFCYGHGKAEHVEKLAAQRGYDLRLSYAYTDSASDLPLLEMVGHPVAVNPDSALESVAHQRGWPVVVFARRAKQVIKVSTAATGATAMAAAAYLLGRRHGRIGTLAALVHESRWQLPFRR